MTLPIVYHPDYMASLKPRHRFPMSKYGYLRDELVRAGLMAAQSGYIAPVPAGFAQIAAVHDPGYVDRVFNQTLTNAEQKAIGLPSTDAVSRRARLSAAGTTLAARLALEHGIACNAAGGSHHADADGGAGYCVFNDVAIAARSLLDDGQVGRVLIVDVDVHQGDGSARIFARDPRAFTLSVHAAHNFPSRKAASDLDVHLPDGVGDQIYVEAVRTSLAKVLQEFDPDIAFVNAGVDPHVSDRLGRLSLTDSGLRARERSILEELRARLIPVVGVLGGGYDRDIQALARRHAILFEEAARFA